MTRTKISEDDLVKWLNSRLHEHEDFSKCSFTSISRLTENDKNGCNWWKADMRCSGVPAEVCQRDAALVVTEAKKRFNVI